MTDTADEALAMATVPITLELMVRHNISLLAPTEPGLAFCAQVWLHQNNFIAEHVDPEEAIRTCLIELEEEGLLDRAQITPGPTTGKWHKWP